MGAILKAFKGMPLRLLSVLLIMNYQSAKG